MYKIGLDIDDVLYHITPILVQHPEVKHNQTFGKTFSGYVMQSWDDLFKIIPEIINTKGAV